MFHCAFFVQNVDDLIASFCQLHSVAERFHILFSVRIWKFKCFPLISKSKRGRLYVLSLKFFVIAYRFTHFVKKQRDTGRYVSGNLQNPNENFKKLVTLSSYGLVSLYRCLRPNLLLIYLTGKKKWPCYLYLRALIIIRVMSSLCDLSVRITDGLLS